ncbi:MAG: hypothetical protein JW882_03020, partial [Deltaproteobacteria bacterium]|nr:hypothetical protein [Deltaproteobacteria bacterium]
SGVSISFAESGTCPPAMDMRIQVQAVYENDEDNSIRNMVEPWLPRPGTTEDGVTYVSEPRNLVIKYMFIRYGDDASPELRNKIRFSPSLWKKGRSIAAGNLVTTMDRVGLFEPEIMLWKGIILKSRIRELLVPVTMDIEIDEKVAEVITNREINPEKFHVTVKEIRDQFGPIIREPEGDIYCITLRVANQLMTLESEPEYFTESELLDSGADIDLLSPASWAWECFPDNPDILKNCNRPRLSVIARMSKIYGSGFTKDPLIKTPEDQEVTLLCPYKITSDSVISVKPGEKTNLPFKVVSSFINADDRPVEKIIVGEIKISDPSFGRLSLDQLQTDHEGRTDDLYLEVNEDVQEGREADITCRLCAGVPDSWLGKDQEGKPIPWTQTGRIKVVILPRVEVNIDAHVELAKELVTENTGERSFQEDRDVTKADGTFGLHFTVQFESRTEERFDDPEIGFRGYRIMYRGKAEDVKLSVSHPATMLKTYDVNGWFTNSDCGKVSYSYRESLEEHRTILKNPSIGLDVIYAHFVPDKDSALRDHPVEGLMFTQVSQSMSPSLIHEIRLESASREDQPGSCSVSTVPEPPHTVRTPFMIDQSFPMALCSMLCEDCYGFEEIFEPIMENEARELYRKVRDDGMTFDALHISKNINLGTGDRASCWEIEDSPDTRHSGFVRGKLKWDFTVKTLDGKFDLSLIAPVSLEDHGTGGRRFGESPAETGLSDSEGPDTPGDGGLFMIDEHGNPISPEEFIRKLIR